MTMIRKPPSWVFQVLIACLVLLVVEVASCAKMNDGLVTDAGRTGDYGGVDAMDPLLGWGASDELIQRRGHVVSDGLVVLDAGVECDEPLNVLITGGSTSDVLYDPHNWPVELVGMLGDRYVCARLLVGATTAFNSGQELLRVLRDGLALEPHAHISLSGTNDSRTPGYVRNYEIRIFRAVADGPLVFPLPNTVRYLRHRLARTPGGRAVLLHPSPVDPLEFWQRNMLAMQGLASTHGHEFIGILQPVLGFGLQTTERLIEDRGHLLDPSHVEGLKRYVALHEEFYPGARRFAREHAAFMHDASGLFEGEEELVFVDSCHLVSAHQRTLAAKILEALESRVDLSDFGDSARPRVRSDGAGEETFGNTRQGPR